MYEIRPGNLEKRNLVAGHVEVDPGMRMRNILPLSSFTTCVFTY